jgi:hypothetical protein
MGIRTDFPALTGPKGSREIPDEFELDPHAPQRASGPSAFFQAAMPPSM